MTTYKFREYSLDTVERRVFGNGHYVDLTPKAFDVLQFLVERSGEIVSKDEILGRVWNGSFVEEGNLPVHISKVRRLLEGTSKERFIETAHGTGYRFTAPVRCGSEIESQNESQSSGFSHDNSFPNSAESHRLYLKGRYLFEKREIGTVLKAVEFFGKSISRDPTNVLAYVDTVECYVFLYAADQISREEALGKIRPIISVAQLLDQSYSTVHSMYGCVKTVFDWDLMGAEADLLTALRLDPHNLIARYRYSKLLLSIGFPDRALSEMRKIIELDGFSLAGHKKLGRLFYCLRQFENSRGYLQEAHELEPTDTETSILLGATLSELGNYDRALDIFHRLIPGVHNSEVVSMIGYVNALQGNKEEARRTIRELQHGDHVQKNEVMIARIHWALGDKERVFSVLDRAVKQHDFELGSLSIDPRWAEIDREDRFRNLSRKLGYLLPGSA